MAINMKIFNIPSQNYSNKSRTFKDIKYLIIHYTGMQSEIASIKRLTNIKSKVSCHYFLNRNGKIFQLVKDNKIAWHAGKSKWGGKNNLNKYSIGIELQNQGHKFKYENFTRKQINSLILICKKLKKKYKIKNLNILGHSDIAPFRKIDPGEKFPWKVLNRNGLGIWYNKSRIKKNKTITKQPIIRKIFFKNLYKIGYRYFNILISSKRDKKVIEAFQRRYVQNQVNGKIDKKSLIISQLLANQIKNS
tara:strand:- start:174 stop:917 length:744 start_codon:yes stop_codon:yes gene_type:complete